MLSFIVVCLVALVLVDRIFVVIRKKNNNNLEVIEQDKNLNEEENIILEYSLEILQQYKELHLIGSSGELLILENVQLILKTNYNIGWVILRRRLAILLNSRINQFGILYYYLMFGNKLSISVNNKSEYTENQKIFKCNSSSSSSQWFKNSFGKVNDQAFITVTNTEVKQQNIYTFYGFFLLDLFYHFSGVVFNNNDGYNKRDDEEMEIGSINNYKSTLLLINQSLKIEKPLSIKDSKKINSDLKGNIFNFQINNVKYNNDVKFSILNGDQVNTFQFIKIPYIPAK